MTASIAMTTVGAAAVGYGAYTKQPKDLLIPLAYFTGMEALQAMSYTVIDICGIPLNQILTVLSFIHIAFQPFFINMLMMYFIPQDVKKRIQGWVYGLCGIATVSLLLQLYPFNWSECVPGSLLCSEQLCTVSGDWHLAWEIPLNGIFNYFASKWFVLALPGYFLAGLVLPFVYGAWKPNLFHIVLGPLAAYFLLDNMSEAGAVWCLISIGLIILVLPGNTIGKYLHTQKWFFYEKPKGMRKKQKKIKAFI
ncbi:MAG TPA: DUF5765 domain-containing protein [Candidatus Gracilibacteria bacterium]